MQAFAFPVSAIRWKEGQEELWQDLFSNPEDWWDNRAHKRGPTHPDFKNKRSRETLWLNSPLKPSWVDARLTALDNESSDTQHLNAKKKTLKDVPSPQVKHLSQEIEILCKDGHIYKALDVLSQIDALGSVPPARAYIALLRACIRKRAASHVRQVHAHLLEHKVNLSGLVGDFLAMTLAKCGCLDDARAVFDTLSSRTVFSWTALISAYVECDNSLEALEMYRHMEEDGVEPDNHTLVCVLKACARISDLDMGKKLHEAARDKGSTSNAFVLTTLVSMYCKCGAIVDAENVLAESNVCNIQAINAILSAYIEKGLGEKALLLFRQLQEEGIKADEVTFTVVLQACSILAEKEEGTLVDEHLVKVMSLEIGRALHADAKRKGHGENTLLGTTLVSMYGKCGTILEVENVFCGLSMHDVVSWSAILSAYVEQGMGEKSLQLFRHMQEVGIKPDRQAFAIAFQACGTLAEAEDATIETRSRALEIGEALHADARRKGVASHVFVGNSIVSMYGKCGDAAAAKDAFDELPQHDSVSWNVLLSMYIEEGMEEKALQIYCQMQEECVVHDEVTLVCALQSCSGAGCIDICRQIHFTIVSAELDCNPVLASSLIHTYGMCASMVDAHTVFQKFSDPDVVLWNACITGYSREGNYGTSVQLFEKMREAGVKPDGTTFCSILSACAHAGLANEGIEYFESMRQDYGIIPDVRHYVNMIDLFARAGDFRRLESTLRSMPMRPDSDIWSCVLAACRAHGNLKLGKWAFDYAMQLEPKDSGTFILMSNILADAEADVLEHAKETVGGDVSWLPALSRIVGSKEGDEAPSAVQDSVSLLQPV